MDEILVRKRWVPWWVGVIITGVCIFFAGVIFSSISQGARGEEGIRVFIPVAAVASYLALALIVNVRIVEVTPKGVRVWMGPVPIGASLSLGAHQITQCYARYIVTRSKGVVLDRFYTAGVETPDGRQIDVYPHFKSPDLALAAAQEIARVLNQGATAHYLQAGLVHSRADYSNRGKALAWGALFLCAVIVGAIWEIRGL